MFFLVVVFLFIGNPSYLMYGRIGLYCSWLWLILFIDRDKQRIRLTAGREGQFLMSQLKHYSYCLIPRCGVEVLLCQGQMFRLDQSATTINLALSALIKCFQKHQQSDLNKIKCLHSQIFSKIRWWEASRRVRLMSSLMLQFLVFSLPTINLAMGVTLLDQRHSME